MLMTHHIHPRITSQYFRLSLISCSDDAVAIWRASLCDCSNLDVSMSLSQAYEMCVAVWHMFCLLRSKGKGCRQLGTHAQGGACYILHVTCYMSDQEH